MNAQEVNNHFGDMDLFLMDLILKGKIPQDAKVLDVGCGEGRNGIYFIQQGYEYHGWDMDKSKLSLLDYLAKSIKKSNGVFKELNLLDANQQETFEFIICSRVLHFAKNKDDFFRMFRKIESLLNIGGVVYLSMDSAVDNELGKVTEDEKLAFPDGKVRFALTEQLYKEIKKGFEEVEPLRTLVHHRARAQSFMVLKKL